MKRDTETTTLRDRVVALEQALVALGDEVRTRRLVVADGNDTARIVGCVTGGTAELSVAQAHCPHGQDTAVLVFANPGEDTYDLGAGIGVQLWATGDIVREMSCWPDDAAGDGE
jgi:hypothetical protein